MANKNNINSIKLDLGILFLNIRSLHKNLDDLKQLMMLSQQKYQFILLAETWLDDSKNHPNLEGYKLFKTNRIKKIGGGVAIYVPVSFLTYEIFELKNTTSDIETIFIKMGNICIGSVYRPPSGKIDKFFEEMQNIMEYIEQKGYTAYIGGDFNIDMNKCTPYSKNFNTIMLTCNFRNLNKNYTRITENSQSNIDLILTNDELSNLQHEVLQIEISDHYPLSVFVEEKIETSQSYEEIMFRNYSDLAINKFKQECKNIKWDQIYQIKDMDEAYSKFYDKLFEIYNNCFPLTTKKNLPKKIKMPWITSDIKQDITKKNRLYKIYMKSKNILDLSIYREFRNRLNRKTKNAKIEYYKKIFITNDKKQTWEKINELMHRKTDRLKIDEILINGEIVNDTERIPNEFNDFFINVNLTLEPKNKHNMENPLRHIKNRIGKCFFFQPVITLDIIREIKNLKNKFSTGYDDLVAKPLKAIIEDIVEPLTYLINLSFETGVFPKQLKTALVKPIHKKGDTNIIGNYRPISILPLISKIYEKIVTKQIMKFIYQNKILYERQYGFLVNRTTEMAVLDLVEQIYKNMDENETSIGIFLDIQKAFDTISHNILIAKLEKYGFRGIVNDWFKSYLKDRMQIVEIMNYKSSEKLIKQGVPQGSVLGPILFLIYINDIYEVIENTSPILYADDTNILFHNKDTDKLIKITNQQLMKIESWFMDNKLNLNYEKTQFIIWSPKSKKESAITKIVGKIQIGNNILQNVSSITYLGIILDDQLQWDQHINYVITKIVKTLGILRKIKPLINDNILKNIYYTLIYSYLKYGIVIWGDTNKIFLNKLLILQKRFLRILYNVGWFHSISDKFQIENLLTIQQIYTYQTGQLMFRIIKEDNFQLSELFTKFSSVYNFRYKLNLILPKLIKEKTKRALSFKGATLWNSIPEDIKNIINYSVFKSVYKKYIIANILT